MIELEYLAAKSDKRVVRLGVSVLQEVGLIMANSLIHEKSMTKRPQDGAYLDRTCMSYLDLFDFWLYSLKPHHVEKIN